MPSSLVWYFFIAPDKRKRHFTTRNECGKCEPNLSCHNTLCFWFYVFICFCSCNGLQIDVEWQTTCTCRQRDYTYAVEWWHLSIKQVGIERFLDFTENKRFFRTSLIMIIKAEFFSCSLFSENFESVIASLMGTTSLIQDASVLYLKLQV